MPRPAHGAKPWADRPLAQSDDVESRTLICGNDFTAQERRLTP